MVPSASLLAVPLSVTVAPTFTVWFAPALATGGVLARAAAATAAAAAATTTAAGDEQQGGNAGKS